MRAAELWRERLPALGQLRSIGAFDKGARKLQCVEVRIEGAQITSRLWDDDNGEPALAVVLHTLAMQPPKFEQLEHTLTLVGAHALARRYERGSSRDERAVLDDLAACARLPETASADIEALLPVADGGAWAGLIGETGPFFIRTFLDSSRRPDRRR
jgi:hypothetical protein